MKLLEQVYSKLNNDIQWIKEHTCFLTIHGSIAYGLNTPESDIDVRGVCTVPKEYLLGFNKNFNEYITADPDCTIFNIIKFFHLTSQGNPNTLELLFVEPEYHIYVNDIGRQLLDNRDYFLSKQLKERYIGYSKAQAHRIRQHRSWLLNPIEKMPLRSDYGLPEKLQIDKNQFDVVKSLIQKKIENWNPDFEPFTDSQKIYLQNKVADILSEINIYSDEKWAAAARSIGLDDNLIHIIKKEKEFENKIEEHKNYLRWKQNRNPKRAAQEAIVGFDCYTEETEFLTENGWKFFDQILPTDKLATVYLGKSKFREYLGVEYQNYTEKFDGTFTGNFYNLIGYHTNVMVTPNHRMLLQEVSASISKINNWNLIDAAHVPHTFNILRQITPNRKNYSDNDIFDFSQTGIPDVAFLRLMGWYLSDGTMAFYKETPDAVVISQIKTDKKGKPGKLYSSIKKFAYKYNYSFYEYDKPPNEKNPQEHIEATIHVRGIIPKIIYRDCGNVENKRIPRWVFSLSKRKMEILLDALIKGDGTVFRPDNGIIYYSSLKNLADDVQELAFLCGFETSLYGPYETIQQRSNGEEYISSMYQVYINKTRDQVRKLGRHSFRKIPVENKRIVCFSVPNSTLITRYNGQVAVHGNCKHATQLVRLLKLGKEILETGKVQVKRTYDREELMEIKTGKWSYERLIEYSDKIEGEVKESYKNSKLPNQPNIKYLDNLCISLVEQALSEK